jgi:hypothetical protein
MCGIWIISGKFIRVSDVLCCEERNGFLMKPFLFVVLFLSGKLYQGLHFIPQEEEDYHCNYDENCGD